jgi:hypothetical protein
METGLSGANKTNSSQSGRDLCFNSLSLTAAAIECMFCFPQNANTLSEAHERDVCVCDCLPLNISNKAEQAKVLPLHKECDTLGRH